MKNYIRQLKILLLASNNNYKGHYLLWSALLFLIVFLIWANFAVIDEVTHGEGKVIPYSQVQKIQNLEGGIIKKIFVHEGQIVNKGQILLELDPTRFIGSYNETLVKTAATQLKVYRLAAEIEEKPFEIPADFIKKFPQQANEEKNLYQTRQQEYKQLVDGYVFAVKELELTKPLVEKDAASPVEVLRLERAVADLKKEIIKYRREALDELNEAKAQLSVLQASTEDDEDRIRRATITSPVKGIVKQIKITTVGGVSQPGETLIEIVPFEDNLFIETKIKPKDIGFIHPNQNAVVKITAYDFAIYGGLEGKVEQISADTITDEETVTGKSEKYYLIRVRVDKNYLGTKEKPLYIIPGMTATVDILTGKKTVLQYLLKPITRARQAALRER